MSSTLVETSSFAATLWKKIVETTREACLLRQEGREDQAVALLQNVLPPVIRDWSRSCGEEPARCRELLRELFNQEQDAARRALLQRRLIVDEVCSRLRVRVSEASRTHAVSTNAIRAVQLRRRVPIGDVVEMIDALQQAERMELEEAVLPARENFSALSSLDSRSFAGAPRGDNTRSE